MKVLLYGGSFDPPHFGHLKMLESAVRMFRPDKIFLIPSFHSPLKPSPRTAVADRIAMLRALVNVSPTLRRKSIEISDFEKRKRRKVYTYETLRYFKDRYPQAEIGFLVGSDSAAALNRWKRPRELMRSCLWIVGRRSADRRTKYPKGFSASTLPGQMPAISSTNIRTRISANEPISKLTPPSVEKHIRRKKLYGLNIRRDLERSLNSHRYHHTLEVARLARALAETQGLDAEQAVLAGLLHDAGRRFSLTEMARYAKRRKLRAPYIGRMIARAPLLLHAFISENLALNRYGVADAEVLSAIRNHTLGAPGMSRLDRLLYIADIAAGDRTFAAAARIRRLAFKDLDAAFLVAVKTKKTYVLREGHWLHPNTGRLLAWAKQLNR